jgi:hypothetical protein
MMKTAQNLVLAVLVFSFGANAQFGNIFEQFMGGQHPHQQQRAPQNVPSDSSWYQQTYDGGMSHLLFI